MCWSSKNINRHSNFECLLRFTPFTCLILFNKPRPVFKCGYSVLNDLEGLLTAAFTDW